MLNLTYCPLNISMDDLQLKTIQNEIRSVSSSVWYRDDFRGSLMLALYTGGGHHQKGQVADKHAAFKWTSPAQELPTLKLFIEENILTWLTPPGRIFLLKTESLQPLHTHIDCKKSETARTQLKFRFVLSGSISSLYFLDDKKIPRAIPEHHRCYLIDGGHPHGLKNSSETDKITLCIGSPWTAQNIPDHLLVYKDAFTLEKPDIAPEWCDQIRLENDRA